MPTPRTGGRTTSGGVAGPLGPSLENRRYDRMLLPGPPTRLVGKYLMLTIGGDRPCVRIHVVHGDVLNLLKGSCPEWVAEPNEKIVGRPTICCLCIYDVYSTFWNGDPLAATLLK